MCVYRTAWKFPRCLAPSTSLSIQGYFLCISSDTFPVSVWQMYHNQFWAITTTAALFAVLLYFSGQKIKYKIYHGYTIWPYFDSNIIHTKHCTTNHASCAQPFWLLNSLIISVQILHKGGSLWTMWFNIMFGGIACLLHQEQIRTMWSHAVGPDKADDFSALKWIEIAAVPIITGA